MSKAAVTRIFLVSILAVVGGIFVAIAAVIGALASGAVEFGGPEVVTVHDGYSYLLEEFGIELAGVVQPAHGLVPSAKELADMITLMKEKRVQVVLTEEDFPEKLLATLKEATGAKVYVISHVATGDYTAEKFEREMAANAKALIEALVSD